MKEKIGKHNAGDNIFIIGVFGNFVGKFVGIEDDIILLDEATAVPDFVNLGMFLKYGDNPAAFNDKQMNEPLLEYLPKDNSQIEIHKVSITCITTWKLELPFQIYWRNQEAKERRKNITSVSSIH